VAAQERHIEPAQAARRVGRVLGGEVVSGREVGKADLGNVEIVEDGELAEEVVQETWIALIKGIDSFEGRSSLRTWLFAVMINIAKAHGIRERRDADARMAAFAGVTVDPGRFRPASDTWPGHWKRGEEPAPFPDTPEGSVPSVCSSTGAGPPCGKSSKIT